MIKLGLWVGHLFADMKLYFHILLNKIAKYQLVAVGNFERMKNLDSKSAATVRQLVLDAEDRESIHNNTPSKVRKE